MALTKDDIRLAAKRLDQAGQVVLAGSFIRPIETRKGDTIQAAMDRMGRSVVISPDVDGAKGVFLTCRISRSNIQPISTAASIWANSSK
jgi:hypothetical protein